MRRRPLVSRLLRAMLWLAFAWLILSVGAVAAMRWVAPPTSAFMLLDRAATSSDGRAYAQRHRWIDSARISPHMKVAVIAAEDQKFPEHHGFDVDSINDAMAERERGGRVRGASTISQQVAKNLFLWSERSWVRKGFEAYFTALIELMWPKQRILEVYLNLAEFGRGVFGVGAASEVYFRKQAVALTAADAALLAAVLPNPKRLRVDAPSQYVRSRQEWIMGQMRGLGGTGLLGRLDKK
jgi:monofunctional glycosyltransferase